MCYFTWLRCERFHGRSKRSPLSNAGHSGKQANNYIGRRNYIHNIYSTPIYSIFIILPKASRVWQVLICCC
ncbi:hypothetical protein PVAP13_4KG239220 [Panicum virgatum]|uniref:Uncharacterized protein n=1 Tax=Panicum virgatum TaxID=38727 RepID=A0A8T0TS65_PANVG|nr:hypothetical protein PVAP13_4KG239220 [Panicum virgatum]